MDWVIFKYERLPIICYWCGCLNYIDKDYEWWIDSEGSLTSNDQEYGPWIRVAPMTKSKKSIIHVPGFYEARKKKGSNGGPQGVDVAPLVGRGSDGEPLVAEVVNIDSSSEAHSQDMEIADFGGGGGGVGGGSK